MTGAAPLPDVDIRLNGTALPFPARHDVRSVVVEQAVGDPAWFAFELSNWDPDRLQPAWSDGPLFEVGGAVEIQLGYVGDLAAVLEGEITSLEPAFTADGPPVLTVAGYDRGHRLTRTRKARSFLQMSDSGIAGQIAREAGLQAETTDSGVTCEYVAQADQTDWAFLRDRAERIGYELFVRGRKLLFRPPAVDAAPAQTLIVGSEVSDFRPRLSAVGPVGEVAVRGWDVTGKQAVVGQGRAAGPGPGGRRLGSAVADAAFGSSTTARVDLAPRTKAEADQIAKGVWTAAALGYVQGTADGGGNSALQVGTVVEIKEAGTRFSGPYYVTGVTHSLDAEAGYRTSLMLERSAA